MAGEGADTADVESCSCDGGSGTGLVGLLDRGWCGILGTTWEVGGLTKVLNLLLLLPLVLVGGGTIIPVGTGATVVAAMVGATVVSSAS